MGQGKTLGLILIFVGLIIGLAMTLWLGSSLAVGNLRLDGFFLGVVLLLLLAVPFIAVGAVIYFRGRRESKDLARVAQERKLLSIVSAHGQVTVAEAALELNCTREQLRDYIYDLVGKELFTGYINWDDGILYARDAATMHSTKCPNCGGEREVVGKGVVKCPFCGSELFV